MFDLKRFIKIRRPGQHAVFSKKGAASAEPVQLVAIVENTDDSATLQRIAQECRWRIAIVQTSSAAIASLDEQPTPLVICDRDLKGEDWKEVLARIAALPQAVCVLLASGVIDDYLWRQVIRNHGYDVVSKPFQQEELRRAVTFAWSWRGWAHRHYLEISGTSAV